MGEAALLVAYILTVLLACALGTRRIFRRGEPPAPAFAPNARLIAPGIGLMAIAPTLWTFSNRPVDPFAPTWGIWAGLAAFVSGWHLAGAGLRPRGRPWRGALLALLLYVTIGLTSPLIAEWALFGRPDPGGILPGGILWVLIWPIILPLFFDLFGFYLN